MRILLSVVLVAVIGCQTPPAPTNATAASKVAAPAVAVREAHEISGTPRVDVSLDGDTMHVHAISPGGIGRARIELTSGAWPRRAVVHLNYAPGRPFTRLEGAEAILEGPSLKAEAKPTPLEVRKMATGGFEILAIPATDKKILHVSWVDAYR